MPFMPTDGATINSAMVSERTRNIGPSILPYFLSVTATTPIGMRNPTKKPSA